MVLSKALEVLPIGKEKDGQVFSALSDQELRYRHRHLDLIANPTARKKLLDRSRIVSSVRRYFDQAGYLEVETPLLQIEAGGAAARPFLTHYNAYDIDVKLRISLELYLKRIICGDVPKVYEIGRVFRNEGVSNRHNPEFTLLEFYEAYANLEDMMVRVEEVFRQVAHEVFGGPIVKIPLHTGDVADEDGTDGAEYLELDFSKPWRRVSLLGEIERHTGLTTADLSDLENAKSALRSLNVVNPVTGKRIDPDEENNLGGLIEKLLEVFVEPTLQEPTFVVGYPIETSPLAKKDPENPKMTRRFEGYIRGREVCNAFSEINDPIDQRERFENQLEQAAGGNDEAHPMDEEFIYALECGMPPTGGCGIGIDRMAMMLTGAETLREVLLFPTMRPERHAEPEAE
jgi:lysyl-tRNA synthetase class 2